MSAREATRAVGGVVREWRVKPEVGAAAYPDRRAAGHAAEGRIVLTWGVLPGEAYHMNNPERGS
jgi:hypothetical protein